MQPISIDKLSEHAQLEIHAVDPMIYLVFATCADLLIPVVDQQGERMRFPSRGATLQRLREAGVSEVTFVHRSAYGEMVGLAEDGQMNEMRQIIRL
ncbi:MAG: DUF6482 family protein [bacterium]